MENFTEVLMKWHKRHNNREMLWKGEKDPYKIWLSGLSEVFLQQTRVAQGRQYYTNFIKKYPTIFQPFTSSSLFIPRTIGTG
ncbi:MAG: hypothetical protein V4539_20430 [Bacteroidota bacterium]